MRTIHCDQRRSMNLAYQDFFEQMNYPIRVDFSTMKDWKYNRDKDQQNFRTIDYLLNTSEFGLGLNAFRKWNKRYKQVLRSSQKKGLRYMNECDLVKDRFFFVTVEEESTGSGDNHYHQLVHVPKRFMKVSDLDNICNELEYLYFKVCKYKPDVTLVDRQDLSNSYNVKDIVSNEDNMNVSETYFWFSYESAK